MLTLVEQDAAKQALDNARERWPRADDAWEAATWAIARDPSFGTALTESGAIRLAVLQGARSIGLPTLELIYEVEDPFIVIHEANFSDAKAPQAGHG